MIVTILDVLKQSEKDPGTYVTAISVTVDGKEYSTCEARRFHTDPTDDQRRQALELAKRRVMCWVEGQLFGGAECAPVRSEDRSGSVSDR